jgi:hypothetical protein
LWVRAFNAKKASLDADGPDIVSAFHDEAIERLRLAGA